MLRRSLLVLLLAAGFVLAIVVSHRDGGGRPPATPRSAQREPSEATEAARLEAPLLPTSAPGPSAEREVAKPTMPAEGGASSAEAAVAAPQLAELRGRLLFEDGAPAAGVAVRVHGWQGNHERASRFGLPETWEDPQGVTGPDGRFSLRFDPPRAFQFVLDAKTPGFAEASWRWSEIRQGEVKDLGDVALLRGGAIEARVVDAGGRALTKGWTVYAEVPQDPGFSEGRENTRVIAHMPEGSGVFRLEDLPAGPATLTAHSDLANWIEGPTVEVRAGETTQADIPYSGPDNSRRITVVTFSRPFHVVDAESSTIHLYGAGSEVRTAQKIPGSSQSHSFDDLPEGAYRI